MSGFTIRIRFRIPPQDRIGIDEDVRTYHPEAHPEIVIRSAVSDQPIREAEWLILKSEGWPSEDEAAEASERLMDALRMALGRFGMAADLGGRAPRSGFFRAGLEMASRVAGRPALNDEHGAMVFPTALDPAFARAGTATAIRTMQPELWEKAFLHALGFDHVLSERERTAFDLYCGAALTSANPDARFVLSFAALEALLEETPRSEAVVEHVDGLIETTEHAALPDDERESLLGSLRWLRFHSIRRAGVALVRERLAEREYAGRPVEQFFLDCYDMRNRLLHGRLPLPTRQEVGSLAAPLEMMIGHLLAGPVLALDV